MKRVRIIKVIQVDNRRFSTVKPAVEAVAWNIAMTLWGRHRDKYWHSGVNYDALDRLNATAVRRITPILTRAFT